MIRARIPRLLAVGVAVAPVLAAPRSPGDDAADAGSSSPPNRIADDAYLVGVYYFAGWWRDLPNKYHVQGKDWRTEWPERDALLGAFNEQATMDREIETAARYGVDYFQILWYAQTNTRNREKHQHHLNAGLDHFVASPNNHLMRFTIEFVNHPPFSLENDADWREGCRIWCEAMKHPSYLRVGGRPVFKIHSVHHFLEQNNHDQKQVDRRIATLRAMAREAGVGDPLISGGGGAGSPPTRDAAGPYDFLSVYMDVPRLEPKPEPYPYEDLFALAEKAWTVYAAKASKPYVPYVPAGWDPRPWSDPRPSFVLPDREAWTEALHRVKRALDASPRLGIPSPDGKRRKSLLIYAWNEYGEGGIVAPTRGQKTMKLECLREVFGAPATRPALTAK